MMRWSLRILIALLTLALALFIILMTQSGFRASFNLAMKLLPGSLTYETLSGTLTTPLKLSKLSYENDSLTLTVNEINLNWSLTKLLLKNLKITSLQADTLEIQFKKRKKASTPSDPKTPTPLKLPLSVHIQTATLTNLKIINRFERESAYIDSIKLKNFTLSQTSTEGEAWILMTRPYAVSSHLILKGNLDHYNLNWSLQKDVTKVSLVGEGNTQGITLSIKKLNLPKSTASGKVNLKWYPFLAWTSDLNFKELDLAQFYPSLPYIQLANLETKGSWKNELPIFTANLHLLAPGAEITLKGNHQKTWDVKYDIKISKLERLLPQYQGSFVAKGNLTGSSKYPVATGQLNGENLMLESITADSLSSEFNLDFSLQKSSHIQFKSTHLTVGNFYRNSVEFLGESSPSLKKMSVQLTLTDQKDTPLSFTSTLQGEVKNKTWTGTLSQLLINSTNTQNWRLEKSTPLQFSKTKVKLKPTYLLSKAGKSCVTLGWQKKGDWKFNLTGQLKNLNLLTGLLYPELEINAPASYSLSASGEDSKLDTLDSKFTLKAGSLNFSKAFRSQKYNVKSVNFSVKTKGKSLNVDAHAAFTKNDELNSKLVFNRLVTHFNNNTLDKTTVRGELKFRFSDLKVLKMFFPELNQPKGTLLGNLKIVGSLPLPDINGQLQLKNGFVEIPGLKLKLEKISAELQAQNKKLSYTLKATTSNTPLIAKGVTRYENNKLISEITVVGNNILIANTPQYYIYASPHITIRLVGNNPVITGSLTIPKAILRPLSLSQTVSLPEDTVVITNEQEIGQSNLNYLMNLTLKLGEEVKVDTHGLKSKLTGEIQISRKNNQPVPTANGQIKLVDAEFNAQGKKLKITKGSNISYSQDALSNPHLNIRAFREVTVTRSANNFQIGPTKTQVGIDIKGTAKRPKLLLFSSPVKLSQADILSYLLFDSPSSGSSLANLTTLLGTLTSLNLNSNNEDSSIAGIKQKLGISQLGVQQQTYVDAFGTPLGVNQASLVIGSYITPKIYVQYNHGLLSDIDIYQVRYILNPNWSLQTETGTGVQNIGTGVDILYTVSRKNFPW